MIEIRPTTESDTEVLSELARKTFVETFAKDNRQEDIDLYVSNTFSREKQLQEIRDPYRRIEIAWSAGQAVGFLHLYNGSPDPSVIGPKPIELLRLYVDSRWLGRGVGSLLMNKSIDIARREGFQTLWLGVWERNLRAQAFYTKFSFIRVGSHQFKLGNDDQIDFIMTRPLTLNAMKPA